MTGGMALPIVLRQIEAFAGQPMAATLGRDAVPEFCKASIIIQAGLDLDETEQAFGRLEDLLDALPIVLVTPADRSEAAALCRTAADRLAAGAWLPAVIETWPAPIAHEVQAIVDVLAGAHGRPPSPEGALMQLRDLAETLVKLPAVVLARRVIERGGAEADLIGRPRQCAGRKVAGTGAPRRRHGGGRGAEGTFPPLGDAGRRRLSLCPHAGSPQHRAQRRDRARRDAANPAETARLVAWFVAGQRGDTAPGGVGGPIPAGVTIAAGLQAAVDAAPWHGLRLWAEAEGGAIDLTGAAALRDWHRDERHHDHDSQALPIWLDVPGGVPLRLSPLLSARVCRECGRRDVFFFDAIYDTRPWRVVR